MHLGLLASTIGFAPACRVYCIRNHCAAQCRLPSFTPLQGTVEGCSGACDAQPLCRAFAHEPGSVAACTLYGPSMHAGLPQREMRRWGPMFGVWQGFAHAASEVNSLRVCAHTQRPARTQLRASCRCAEVTRQPRSMCRSVALTAGPTPCACASSRGRCARASGALR
jgi:hypothetical protein